MELIKLRDIHKTYYMGDIEVPVLRGISLSIRRGDFVALMGASGSGKTTLMNILGCLDRPSSGQYWLDGREVGSLPADERALLRNEKIGFVFQNFNLLPRTSALENVSLPLLYAAEGLTNGACQARARELLTRTGLTEQSDHEPSQLSGGQQQRVAIARSLVNRPPLLLADEPTGNLDSRTSEEVLRIFEKLNAEEGVTIILVTHDPNVAGHATRIIQMRDGVMEQEHLPVADSPVPESEERDIPVVLQSKPAGPLVWLRRMLRTALNALRRNVLRAALTTLGIVIGVAAVIAMMEIGQGSAAAIQQSIASMGANNLLVRSGTASSRGVSFGAGSMLALTPGDADAIARECSAVRAVAPVVRARTQVIYGHRNWVPSYIYGTTRAFLEVRDWALAEGRTFTDSEVRNAAQVCVLGQTLLKELFDGRDPLGQELRIRNVSFRVIGVLATKGANMVGMDQDDVLLAPWTAIQYRVTASKLSDVNQSAAGSTTSAISTATNTLSDLYPAQQGSLYPVPSTTQAADTPLPVRFANVDEIRISVRSAAEIPAAIEQITQLLRERHRIRAGEPEDFNIRDMTEVIKTFTSTSAMMTNLLLAVALISLVVGGVGIMNIMLVSVTERTREIGLRMAVGARSRNILQQFLVESVILCFCGGLAGIFLGQAVSWLIATLLKWPTQLSVGAIVAAFVVSAAVGIVFGYYPAWKASRLDPIVALRYE